MRDFGGRVPRLLDTFQESSAHLGIRDDYGMVTELPYIAKWAADEPDDLSGG